MFMLTKISWIERNNLNLEYMLLIVNLNLFYLNYFVSLTKSISRDFNFMRKQDF